MVDLGKMLLEAFEEVGRVYLDSEYETLYTRFEDAFVTAQIAEAFLAKVREAEKAEAGDHTGPVPFYGDVE